VKEKIITVNVPQLGVNDQKAELIEWCVLDEGDVSIGDILCTLETAKAVFDVESEASGYIVHLVDAGSNVEINQTIAMIGTSINELRKEKEKYISDIAIEIEKEEYIQDGIKATKKARELAKELDIKIANISTKGIIKERDVLESYNSNKRKEKEHLDITWDKDKEPVVIYGAGKGSVTIKECIDYSEVYEVVCFLDDDTKHKRQLCDLPVFHSSRLNEIVHLGVNNMVCGIGNGKVRLRILEQCNKLKLNLINVIHPKAFISPSVKLGKGNFIKAGAIIETNTILGNCCIIDNGVVIAHDNTIGNGCHIAPGVSMGSNIIIEDLVIIGVGSSLSTNLRIGRESIISIGSSVVKDVSEYSVIEGVPGKIVGMRKKNNFSF